MNIFSRGRRVRTLLPRALLETSTVPSSLDSTRNLCPPTTMSLCNKNARASGSSDELNGSVICNVEAEAHAILPRALTLLLVFVAKSMPLLLNMFMGACIKEIHALFFAVVDMKLTHHTYIHAPTQRIDRTPDRILVRKR